MASSDDIIAALLKDLQKNVDKAFKNRWAQKKSSTWIGVRVPLVRKIAHHHYQKVALLSNKDLFDLCERLLKSNVAELKTVAFSWTHKRQKSFSSDDFLIFKRWVERYISSQEECDDFCIHCLGPFLKNYPEHLYERSKWSSHPKWPVRRALAVALIFPLRKKRYLREVFMTANSLLLDQHPLVQKGYRWMLKEASKHYPKSVQKYTLKHGLPPVTHL